MAIAGWSAGADGRPSVGALGVLADARSVDPLIEALDDPDLVVRRYAAKNLFEIVQPAASDRIRYRPDGLEEMRRQGVAWWRTQLEKQAIRRKRL